MATYRLIGKFAGIAVAAALACAGVAQAASYSWGVHDATESLSVGVAPGSFKDTLSFSIADYAVVQTSTTVANQQMPTLHITGGTYSVINTGGNNLIGGGDDFVLGSWSFDGTTGQTQNSINLTAGSYYIAVQGVSDGSWGGFYTVTSSIAPIPEPEVYAMLAAGLGLMGFVARRRKAVAI